MMNVGGSPREEVVAGRDRKPPNPPLFQELILNDQLRERKCWVVFL